MHFCLICSRILLRLICDEQNVLPPDRFRHVSWMESSLRMPFVSPSNYNLSLGSLWLYIMCVQWKPIMKLGVLPGISLWFSIYLRQFVSLIILGRRGPLALFCGMQYKWILLNFNALSLTGLMWGSFFCCIYIKCCLLLAISSPITRASSLQLQKCSICWSPVDSTLSWAKCRTVEF